jgi:uncharacterized protein (DUF58 family)
MSSLATTHISSGARAAVADSPRRSSATLGLSITFAGLLTGAVVILVGLAALTNEDSLLFLLFGISIGALVISALLPIWMVGKIQVERFVPDAVVAGRPFKIIYVLRSRRRWSRSWSLLVGERPVGSARLARFPQAFLPVLRPNHEARFELTGHCPHRGCIALSGVRLQSRFPFGLFACGVDFDLPVELVVYPAISRLRRDPWRDPRLAGRSASRAGAERSQDEFFGVREYRFGDNLRWVHWRRSARTGTLVVREMMPVRPTQLIVLLDPWPGRVRQNRKVEPGHSNRRGALHQQQPAPPPQPEPGLPDPVAERLLSAAATVLCDGLERGHRVGLICRSAVPLVIPPGAGRPQRQRVLHQLAQAEPGAEEELYEIVTRIRWSAGWHARCMICTTEARETHQQVLRFLAPRAEAAMLLTPEWEGFDTLFEMARGPVLAGEAT